MAARRMVLRSVAASLPRLSGREVVKGQATHRLMLSGVLQRPSAAAAWLQPGHSFCRSFTTGSYEESIAKQLKDALGATSCTVVDQSGGCGASFNIAIEAEAFRGKSRIQQQRMVQQVIKEDIAKWHAVTIQVKIPEESQA
eukprot:TRINITY_DN45514_c0_g1_i1.p1 TRINITY_DN45514_c0_g1~~TRINITY_DN45514_c0_g1_i1.p1  ORF type:complete len:141 (-),score=28.37 TRINITY_DN45514_c0_g1_i1:28-450(-)